MCPHLPFVSMDTIGPHYLLQHHPLAPNLSPKKRSCVLAGTTPNPKFHLGINAPTCCHPIHSTLQLRGESRWYQLFSSVVNTV